MRRVLFPLFLAVSATAAEIPPEALQHFEQKIRPALAEHCYECHSDRAKKLKGNLRLDSKAGWEKGGDSGEPVIVPGKPEESLLIQSLQHLDEDLAMPPKKPKLPETIIADFVAWVKMGAPDPREGAVEAKRADKSWWSLQPLATGEPPSPNGLPETWADSPIDRFVFAKLAEKGLTPNLPADPRTLIRRMTYDLTGLPPAQEEVEAYAADSTRNPQSAIRNLIDRLLASPRYGEHWGRHWLDVVRFGESTGFERNTIVDNAWPFRDYVIRSFNDDKPMDRLIVEHLAGDVIGKDNPEIEVGTTFLVAGPYDNVGNADPVAKANIRAATLDDVITATGSAFLGLTVNCARCHNHKFDPIPAEDYYRMRAAFEGVTHGDRVLATPQQRAAFTAATAPLNARKKALTKERDELTKTLTARAEAAPPLESPRPAPDSQSTEETFATTEAQFVRLKILGNSVDPKTGVGAQIDEFEVWTDEAEPRNVALATAGAKVQGASGRSSGDSDRTYGVGNVIDGKYGERWFVGNPAELTITLPRPERIQRVVFSNDRTVSRLTTRRGVTAFVAEYEIHVSSDGTQWQKVADSLDRQPVSPAHAQARQLQRIITPEERDRLAGFERDLANIERELRAVPALPQVWAGKFAQPNEATFLHKGGDPQKPGAAVPAASLSVLDRVTPAYELAGDAAESERRLRLARWIASDENPLTARVLVNRVWHYHFGTGLVDTPSDFGFLGSRPTHPELLDFLARRLHAHGWRLKALHREILLSQAYQQSGVFQDEAARTDRDARLLWRFPPRRLSAEEVRDTMLAVAGRLDLRMEGPGFRLYRYSQDNVSTYFPLDAPGPETYRRAVYHQNARASVIDVLSDFDLPDNAFPAPRRASTTSPLQTLTLLNHQFTLDMAEALATRIASGAEEGTTVSGEQMIERAFALAFQRAPTAQEIAAATALIATHGPRAFCRAMLNANELLYLE
jgi:mono/diheme cytochrome c family protein